MSKTLPARLRSPPPWPHDAPEMKRSRSTSCRGPFGRSASSSSSGQLNVWDLEAWTQPGVQPELYPQTSTEEEDAETLQLLDRLVSMEGVIDDRYVDMADLVGGWLNHPDNPNPHLLPPPATAADPDPQLAPSTLTPSLQPQFENLQLAQPFALPACATPTHSSPGWALSMANEPTPAENSIPWTAMVQAPAGRVDPSDTNISAPAGLVDSAKVNVQPPVESVADAMANVLGLPEKLGGGSGQNKAERFCWTSEEDAMIVAFVREYGQKWRLIASMLQGRSDDAVRNRWNRVRDLPEHNNGGGRTPLRKQPALKFPQAGGSELRREAPAATTALAAVDDDGKPERVSWSRWEDDLILRSVSELGHKWHKIATRLPGRTGHAIRNRNSRLQSLASRGHALSLSSNPGVPIGIQLIPQQRESPQQRLSF